jgi:endonuclease/exonuclease/phosphatase family metal-dependent hydrolase
VVAMKAGPHHVDLRVATYNIHRGRGMDRRTRPERIAEVLSAVGADVIALQEVIGAGRTGASHAQLIGAALGMGWVMGRTRELRGHLFGNVVLARFPVRHHVHYNLSWGTCEPRGCQRVDLLIDDRVLHVYNVHLGTALVERRHQAARLAAIVRDHRVTGPKVVLGDFNEWSQGLATRVLDESLESVDLRAYLRRRRTYPGLFPFLHLDHIYYQGDIQVRHVELHRNRLALMASDHLPLIADLRVVF